MRTSNLAFALFCLPVACRRDMLSFYRWCRLVDDIADAPGIEAGERRAFLHRWVEVLENWQLGAIYPEFAEIMVRHQLDRAVLVEIVRGVAMDLDRNRYATFNDLRLYCWRVASAVGLVSIRIFGCEDSRASDYAQSLGLALQLTNILRDVSEDATLGRIYIPIEDLNRFRVSEDELLHGRPGPGFQGLMHFEAARAMEFFAESDRLIPSREVRRLLPARIMRRIYGHMLRTIAADGFRVFEKRYRVSKPMKLAIALRTAAGL